MKLAILSGLLLLAGCASQPVPVACYTSFYESAGPYAAKPQQEAAQIREAQRQQFWKANCAGRMGGSGYYISPGEVPSTRLRYVAPNYPGGQGGLEPY